MDEVEPVPAGRQCHSGFVPVLGWQAVHAPCIDVGRVADDEVVALSGERREQVAAMECDAIAQPVRRDIASGERQRAGREIDGIDLRGRKGERRQDREAAGTCAEVEHAPDLLRLGDRQGTGHQQVADEGARDQRALVGMEAHPMHVGRAHQIGRGQAQGDAGVDQGEQARLLRLRRAQREPGIDVVDRQAQTLEKQEGCFVDGVGRAVAVGEFCSLEAPDREPEEIAQRVERGFETACHAGLE